MLKEEQGNHGNEVKEKRAIIDQQEKRLKKAD